MYVDNEQINSALKKPIDLVDYLFEIQQYRGGCLWQL